MEADFRLQNDVMLLSLQLPWTYTIGSTYYFINSSSAEAKVILIV